MTLGRRVVAVSLVVSFLAGPLAPLASAQQPTPPQPDVFKETMKASEPPVARGDDVRLDETFYDITAGVMTGFLVPGRAITCAAGGGVSILVLLLTFGSAYKAATRVLEEGCGGKWIVRGEDLMPDRPPIMPPADKR